MTDIDVEKMLYEVCGDSRVYDPGVDLIDSGLLDSLAMIDLFTALEDGYGIVLYPTRIDREKLRSADGIRELIAAETEKS